MDSVSFGRCLVFILPKSTITPNLRQFVSLIKDGRLIMRQRCEKPYESLDILALTTFWVRNSKSHNNKSPDWWSTCSMSKISTII